MTTKRHGTADGVELTDGLVAKLAEEAERGYDVGTLKRRGRGRPPIGASAATTFQVRLDPALRKALEDAADADRTTPSEVVRSALREALAPARSGAYWARIDPAAASRLRELAKLCDAGRDAFHASSRSGFLAHPGSEAELVQSATTRADWPGGPWPKGAPDPLHEIGLVIALSAAGHLGELAGLLRSGEFMWSLPLLSRGVLENCARLFAIYVRPLLSCKPGDESSPRAIKQVFAAAYMGVLSDAFGTVALTREVADLAPSDPVRQKDLQNAEARLSRMQAAYRSLFDPTSSDVSSKKKLRLEGSRPTTMTDLVKDLAAWMWPDPMQRPAPLYRVLSGLAHSSLAPQLMLYTIDNATGARRLERNIPVEHIEYLVLVPALLFQCALARLVGYYGLPEDHLHEYSEALETAFPDKFSYGF